MNNEVIKYVEATTLHGSNGDVSWDVLVVTRREVERYFPLRMTPVQYSNMSARLRKLGWQKRIADGYSIFTKETN